MLDIALIRDNPELVKKGIASKNANPGMVDAFLALDERWRAKATELDKFRALQRTLSEERKIEEAKANKEHIKELENDFAELSVERDVLWMRIPNLPSDDTPIGKDEESNAVVRTWGTPREFSFAPKEHLELGEKLGVIDTAKSGEVAGARFAYIKGDLVRLQFAIQQWVTDVLSDEKVLEKIANSVKIGYSAKPFVPVLPPVMIRAEVMQKMARLEPKEERYHIATDDLYLVGSAEHTLGPLHMGEVIPEKDLPIRYLGFSTSFRREAGSYGKDMKGIFRNHQFDKLEMESFTLAEDGVTEQNFLVAVQEHLTQALGIPYRIVICSTGDQGDPDARHLDLEMWMPGQAKYRETHSADYMADYQARRLGTKVRRADGSTEFAHMNDATAFAMSRTPIAIMENYQTEEGMIEIPKVLQSYVGKKIIS
jgi:seryl-tRNA synthetase